MNGLQLAIIIIIIVIIAFLLYYFFILKKSQPSAQYFGLPSGGFGLPSSSACYSTTKYTSAITMTHLPITTYICQ